MISPIATGALSAAEKAQVKSEQRIRGMTADERRARIIAAAKNVFFREGYAGASMSRISAEIGGSKGTLYNYFKSKEDLFLVVVRDIVHPPDGLEVQDFPDVRSYLKWLALAALQRMTSLDSICMQRLAAAESNRFPEIGRIFQDEILSRVHAQFIVVFERLMDDGLMRKASPAEAVEALFDLCSGWFVRRIIWNLQGRPSQGEIERKAEAVVEVFLKGYSVSQGECPRVP